MSNLGAMQTIKRLMGKLDALAPCSADELIAKMREARLRREDLAAQAEAAFARYRELKDLEFAACEDIARAKLALEKLAQ